MTRVWWHLVRGFARACVFVYYSASRVVDADRIPKRGPVLFVVNHPNDLVDAAAVLCAVPRPLRFAARRSRFGVPLLGWVLRRLGAVPVEAVPAAGVLLAFRAHLEAGGATAVFPRQHTRTEPDPAASRGDPAALAYDAEAASDFALGLQVVPLGLHYEPDQEFRGEVHVRVGAPFTLADLRGAPRTQAIGVVRERIHATLQPLVGGPDRADLAPLVRGISEVYDEHQRADGSGLVPRSRAEIVQIAGACLNHFLVVDPEAVRVAERRYARYQVLAARAGVSARAAASRARPGSSAVRIAGLAVGLLAGLPVYAFGLLTSYVPYRATDAFAQAAVRKQAQGGTARGGSLPFYRIVFGTLSFGLYWGLLATAVGLWSQSLPVTLAFVALVAGSAFFARTYARHAESAWARLQGLVPILKPGIRRVARARSDLLDHVGELVRRYRQEAGDPLLPARERKWHQRVPWKAAVVVTAVVWAAWFAWGLRDEELTELPDRPSPWATLDPLRAEVALEQDARSLVGLLDTLAALELRMLELKAGFDAGEREFTDPEDDRAVRQALLTYLNCRSSLYRLAWFYRAPDRPDEPERTLKAFLVGYVAAVELVHRGMQLVEVFEDSPRAIRKLNEPDVAWRVPPGIYERVRAGLANTAVHAELARASTRLAREDASGPALREPPWPRLRATAAAGRDAVSALARKRWEYKLEHAVARAEGTLDRNRYAASRFFSSLVGGIRVRGGDLAEGLISDEQVAWLQAEVLQPGDILLERRNWALSNVFLPGFWTHAAVYVGGVEGVRALGLDDDEQVRPHLAALAAPDAHGHARRVIEAIGQGVVLTSLETSVGEADALCVLRPRLPRARIAAAVARAISHTGKPYDFDFDFFSSDKLVCTELVHRAYQGPLDLELLQIMGRWTLPALEIVKKWAAERGDENAQLELVCFLDSVEDEGLARRGDEAGLLETLERPGLTLLQSHGGSSREPLAALVALGALFALGLVFLRKSRNR